MFPHCLNLLQKIQTCIVDLKSGQYLLSPNPGGQKEKSSSQKKYSYAITI